MRIKQLTIISLLSILASAGVQAQTAQPAAGGNASGTGGTASYTVGQTVYTAITGESGSASQGVQQAYSVSVISSQSGTDGISCTVYPNPAADFIQLDISGDSSAGLHFLLTDMHGRLLDKGEAATGATRIDLGKYAQASYQLTVTDGTKDRKSFQIIKN